MPKQIILAAHFPGVNNTTVWSDPAAGSQIAFESFEHLARTAERGRFDFFFLAEGLRLREQRGRIHDLDVVGRPDTLTVLAALAAVTERLGLAGTLNATFHEPYELARQLATLDHLSGGRAGWNVVTSHGAFFGENFRRGGFLDHADRYRRAGEFIEAARTLWDSDAGDFEVSSSQFGIRGRFGAPRSPQGRPVIIQAGDSSEGRELAARYADAIFSRHHRLDDAQRFYRDVKDRLVRYGRAEHDLKIIPGVSYVLGDTDADAQERAHHIRRQQVSPQTAILLLEQLWNRDLSGYDPDGPLPEVDPLLDEDDTIIKGRAGMYPDRLRTAAEWRALAEAKKLSIRDLIIEVTGRQNFIGTPARVAAELDAYVQGDACDGFILVPHLTPTGLDDFVDRVVPLLQERGVFRTDYETTTLRGHLGLGGD
ncbi:alkanesulfonate monooxygenase SsuD/methylene tetrahydromethanopterin reductase-like flavin-dependent oxidoreductase (luciferase family) [Actinoplanes octamycinicus]|uniref:Alkanesulfonate monooxygenase SsuD/methylene tetrahydromethanopterin reductase-like flavin-dependent oxidoreductase (Luciferase family) n=1 Tax=Actinoplanes octamycinicus TaxID=135948 RepID=A0A7W7GYK2_9ACTN|nr:LLM class flavin-dependent oxidoreductase [Actinoplanes octamycinicus]MBB4740696.1 alkanesulfonate monooxygenase SsuD/methylene tetrahydromethanopterin reductase-like flavin-dependent oxidoreductase (luciferase family) [Actinoplanes octamycinicus]GIE61768.1 nitrilotriacetate monooxygenase component A [Actinoplanes octamycinicus]